MGSLDDTFLAKLKNAWDLYFENNPNLVLAVCGSLSAWIEENIMSSTGFMGRYSYDMTLEELPLYVCNEFWKDKLISNYEKFKILAVTGGIPRYLEFINPNLTAEENIRQMAFEKGSVLFLEFDKMFSDLFTNRKKIYKEIVEALSEGSKTPAQIAEKSNIAISGNLSEYLDELNKSGIISRDFTWSLVSGKESKLSVYRLSDNYSRFYLKYIEPNKNRIISGNYEEVSLSTLPNWNAILGYQFENIVLNNRNYLKRILNIKNEEIIYDNPYFQKKTKRQEACQVDYMIQTTSKSLYIFEIKLSGDKVSSNVIEEVKEKISRLKIGKEYSIRPVLVHVNGVENSVSSKDYFVKIIDFGTLLKEP